MLAPFAAANGDLRVEVNGHAEVVGDFRPWDLDVVVEYGEGGCGVRCLGGKGAQVEW